MVSGVGRWPLTPERGVRFPLGLLSSSSNNHLKFKYLPVIAPGSHFENGLKSRVRNGSEIRRGHSARFGPFFCEVGRVGESEQVVIS